MKLSEFVKKYGDVDLTQDEKDLIVQTIYLENILPSAILRYYHEDITDESDLCLDFHEIGDKNE